MNTPKISVVIPVYNGEKYIERSSASILSQSYRNIELIIVNDGSRDKTPEICYKIRQSDNRVIIIDKPNGGVASARNAGIDAAGGDYIFFLDCDDFLEKNALEAMLSAAIDNAADITSCSIRTVSGNMAQHSLRAAKKPEISGLFDKSRLPELYYMMCRGKPDTAVTMCNKLYRTDIIRNNGIRQPMLVSGEDVLFAFDCAVAASRVYFMENAYFYNYVMNDASFSHSNIPVKDRVAQSDLMYSEFEKRISRCFSGTDMLKKCRAALDLRRAVSVYCFTALILSRPDTSKKDKLSELKYIASLGAYAPALTEKVYSEFPLRYRAVFSCLGKGKINTAYMIMRLIRMIRG